MENKNKTLKGVLKTLAQSFGTSRNNDEPINGGGNTSIDDLSKEEDGIIAKQRFVEELNIESEFIDEEIPVDTTKSVAYITLGQTINGSVVLSDDLVVEGVVNGDVDSSGDIVIRGKICGNIKGDNINIDNAEVIGNVEAVFNLNMFNCNVIGNVIAENVEVNGNVEGNIIAKELCTICEDAIITGDITSLLLVVKKNAKINGIINMTN